MTGACRRAPLVLALLTAAACLREEPLQLLGHHAGPDGGARLNQPIVLTFSAPIDPGSVRADSVRVVRVRDGSVAAGRLTVADASVTFAPRVACRPDLEDGALQPDEHYRVLVPGLPQLACVRSLDGALLGAGVAFEFATVASARDAPAKELFVDVHTGVRPRFDPSAQLVDGRARIRFSKPLDPRTLQNAKFRFRGPWHVDSRAQALEDPLFKACLVENDTEAVIELAVDGPLPDALNPDEKSYAVDVQLSKLLDFSEEAPKLDQGSSLIHLAVATKEKKEKP